MTKVWEETWRADRTSAGAVIGPLANECSCHPERVRCRVWIDVSEDANAEERLHHRAIVDLVSTAPEMARMLLGAEYEGMDLEGNFYCQWCGVQFGDGAEHEPNCEWLLLMKKAGIR